MDSSVRVLLWDCGWLSFSDKRSAFLRQSRQGVFLVRLVNSNIIFSVCLPFPCFNSKLITQIFSPKKPFFYV